MTWKLTLNEVGSTCDCPHLLRSCVLQINARNSFHSEILLDSLFADIMLWQGALFSNQGHNFFLRNNCNSVHIWVHFFQLLGEIDFISVCFMETSNYKMIFSITDHNYVGKLCVLEPNHKMHCLIVQSWQVSFSTSWNTALFKHFIS